MRREGIGEIGDQIFCGAPGTHCKDADKPRRSKSNGNRNTRQQQDQHHADQQGTNKHRIHLDTRFLFFVRLFRQNSGRTKKIEEKL